MMWHIKYASWLLAIVFVLATVPGRAQQNPKRLILKDGNYQTVTKWQITGDRVRYFSAERYGWEELPKDLVDWPATDKYNLEHEKQRTISAAEVAQQEEADQSALDAATPTVAPGLRLPDGGGVFLLDAFHNQPQLVELTQNGGEVNKQTGKNIRRAVLNPLALSSKQTIEIQGQHARVQAHDSQPAIFVNVDSADNQSSTPAQEPGAQPDHYRMIRLEPKKDTRVVGNLSVAVYGKVSQKETWIPTKSTPVGTWVKVTPAAPLAPGEYALVEMLDSKQMNIYVWDFGVNPAAPPNPNSWAAKEPNKTDRGLEKR
jgi:hypothetical protein